MESPESAKWACDLLGQREVIESFVSYQNEVAATGRTTNEQRVLKGNVLDSEVYSLREPSRKSGIEGFFISPSIVPYRDSVPGTEFDDVVVASTENATDGISLRSDSHQHLQRWDDDRRVELALHPENQNIESQKGVQLDVDFSGSSRCGSDFARRNPIPIGNAFRGSWPRLAAPRPDIAKKLLPQAK